MSKYERAYQLIKQLRRDREAPVDFVGPKSCVDLNISAKVYQYQILCCLQLSSLTKDQKTHEAMVALRNHGLTVENISQTEVSIIETLIKPVGFYKKKAIYMKNTAQILIDEHKGEVPKNYEELVKLPGIGPKMAHLTLSEGFGIAEGIGVDSHVHRICNALGWVKTKMPEETRIKLEMLLPKTEWAIVNYEMVGLGQMIQQPIYRMKLAKTLYKLENDQDFFDAYQVLKRIGFELSSLQKLDPDLKDQIDNRLTNKRKKAKLEEEEE